MLRLGSRAGRLIQGVRCLSVEKRVAELTTPSSGNAWSLGGWILAAFATVAATCAIFFSWAVNADSFGKHDLGQALGFGYSDAFSLIACFWLIPTSVVLAIAVTVIRLSSPLPYLLAAAIGVVPFLVVR